MVSASPWCFFEQYKCTMYVYTSLTLPSIYRDGFQRNLSESRKVAATLLKWGILKAKASQTDKKTFFETLEEDKRIQMGQNNERSSVVIV